MMGQHHQSIRLACVDWFTREVFVFSRFLRHGCRVSTRIDRPIFPPFLIPSPPSLFQRVKASQSTPYQLLLTLTACRQLVSDLFP